MAKKWIQKMNMKKGALHKMLGISSGKKIPLSKLNKASKAGGLLAKRASLAKTLRGFK